MTPKERKPRLDCHFSALPLSSNRKGRLAGALQVLVSNEDRNLERFSGSELGALQMGNTPASEMGQENPGPGFRKLTGTTTRQQQQLQRHKPSTKAPTNTLCDLETMSDRPERDIRSSPRIR